MAMSYFPRTFNETDFGLDADKSVTTGEFQKIMSYKVPAQTQIAWGVGEVTSGGADTRKNVYVELHSASGRIDGVYRFALTNANETDIRVKLEDRSENLKDGVEFGETKQRAQQDSYLVVYLKPDADTTVDYDNASNNVLLPASVYQ